MLIVTNNAIVLSVVMLSVVMLNVVAPLTELSNFVSSSPTRPLNKLERFISSVCFQPCPMPGCRAETYPSGALIGVPFR